MLQAIIAWEYAVGYQMLVLRFLRDESGSTAVEYGLLAGLISLVVITALKGIGTRINNKFSAISNNLT